MITGSEALALPRVLAAVDHTFDEAVPDPVEHATLAHLEATLDRSIKENFTGTPFGAMLQPELATPRIVAFLKKRLELRGYYAHIVKQAAGYQMLLIPTRAVIMPAEQVQAPALPELRTVTVIETAPVSTRLLVRMPTRGRPAQALEVLARYRAMAGMAIKLEVVIDYNDATMTASDVLQRLNALDCVITVGNHDSKIAAVNGGRIQDWDILLLASDDMVPVFDGYAVRAVEELLKHYPYLDGAVYFNDGHQKENCCTLPIIGRRLYDTYGYVYNPEYKSLFADQEQTELWRAQGKLVYVDETIIEHRHHVWGLAKKDALYEKNDALWDVDQEVYNRRKAIKRPYAQQGFDTPPLWLSILIATLPERKQQLDRLLDHIYAQTEEFPGEVEVLIDNREKLSIGEKRQSLLERAKGHFVTFIDDDDWISYDFIGRVIFVLESCPEADSVSMRGSMSTNGNHEEPFYISIENKTWSKRDGTYYRSPNHITPVRRELALKAGFPPISRSEDFEYSRRLLPYLKKEVYAGDDPLYYYWYITGKEAPVRYSQNDEEDIILARLTGNGPKRFLDIGAHDGVRLSNTRALADRGWTGTLVEPSPDAFKVLMDNYQGRSEMNMVHVAIVPVPGMLRFEDSRGDFVSTFDEAHKKLWSATGADGRPGVQFQPIYVSGITVRSLLDSFPGPYAFISLDVEGINLQIFKELPLRELDVEVVCVEYQDKLDEIVAHAEAQGYEKCHLTSENAIFVRKVDE